MSSNRAGYEYDLENWQIIRYRGQVKSALRGKRGQKFLLDLIAALDALPQKRLIANEMVSIGGGDVCALGALGRAKGLNVWLIDPEDFEGLSNTFDIAEQLAREVMYENDDMYVTPEQRWENMCHWAVSNLIP